MVVDRRDSLSSARRMHTRTNKGHLTSDVRGKVLRLYQRRVGNVCPLFLLIGVA